MWTFTLLFLVSDFSIYQRRSLHARLSGVPFLSSIQWDVTLTEFDARRIWGMANAVEAAMTGPSSLEPLSLSTPYWPEHYTLQCHPRKLSLAVSYCSRPQIRQEKFFSLCLLRWTIFWASASHQTIMWEGNLSLCVRLVVHHHRRVWAERLPAMWLRRGSAPGWNRKTIALGERFLWWLSSWSASPS